METPKSAEVAHIGRSVFIKGELSGSEDLYVDGQVEGKIELKDNSLTVGPNGQLRANVNAKNVSVNGKLEGNVRASERIELTKSAVLIGDIFAQRIAIEDGAYFKGKVDIQREAPHSTPQPAAKSEPAGVSGNGPEQVKSTVTPPAATVSSGSGPALGGGKTPVTELKKF